MAGTEQNIWAEPETGVKPENEKDKIQMQVIDGQGTPAVKAAAKEAEKETEETKRLRDNFGFFGPAALIYAVFYAFCMYRNGSGVTFPFFVAGSLLFLYLSLAKLGTTLKKGSAFYMAAMVLLGVSAFCTDDGRIIFFNKLGIFLLVMSLLLKQYFDTSKWGLGKFLHSIFCLAFGAFGEVPRPFQDAALYRKSGREKGDRRIWAVGLGLLVGVPLVFVVLMLLASADVLFRRMTDGFLGNISLGNIMNVVFRITFMFLASYCLTSRLCRKRIREEVKDKRTGDPIPAITVTGMLTALYLVFSVVQIEGLFLGRLQLPAGYTYASYAREGFFQLLAVSFLNLVIVLVCLYYFKESKVLKTILTIMSVCTFVMIASSAMRMVLYIRSYYLTFLRVLVLWALALLAVLFVGVLINVFKAGFPLFRYSVAVVTVLYLALSFAHPDYIIARVNVENAVEAGERGNPDYRYLISLCADAAPVLVPYMKEQGYAMEAWTAEETPVEYCLEINGGYTGKQADTFGYYWMERMQNRTKGFGARTFNLSRYRCLKLLEAF
ncbi:MAG: DUF4173 domain-containing protein [Butyrivibrio sp.]|nr:DUF4173 domain-containing protein [Acetatifactor muris]MCM1559554.1 DUF4173 domain-containing protein [Butyrivibrio sp.]